MVPILVLKTHLSCGFLLTVDFLGLRRSGSWPHFSDQPQDLGEQSPRHRNLSHLESNVPSVRDDPGADLDQLLLQAGQRPVLDRLRQSQRPHEVSEIVSKRMKLERRWRFARRSSMSLRGTMRNQLNRLQVQADDLQMHSRAWYRNVRRPSLVTVNGVKIAIDHERMPGDLISWIHLERHEAAEARMCRRVIRPNDRVLELGAGIGFIGSLCALIVGSENVCSYEANARLEPLLRRTHALNGVSPLLRMSLPSFNVSLGAVTMLPS